MKKDQLFLVVLACIGLIIIAGSVIADALTFKPINYRDPCYKYKAYANKTNGSKDRMQVIYCVWVTKVNKSTNIYNISTLSTIKIKNGIIRTN
jgi:hypothetical protein